LFARARELGIALFSSPFDPTAVDLLEKLEAPAYKIASFEIVDLPLIRRVARAGRPMIVSTGMANLREIGDAVAVARAAGCREIAVLHCTSGYPTPPEDSNLRTIADLAATFDVVTGLSDHTRNIAVPIAAVALGASLVEVHLTLRRADGGEDAEFSLEPEELAEMIGGCRTAWTALGKISYELEASEKGNKAFRRSLYAVQDIPAGGRLTTENVRSIRPGYGLLPKHLPDVLGRRAGRAIARGTPLSWSLLEPDA
jgi:pseudaminic acid synthase